MERVLGQFREDRKEGTYLTTTFENAKRGVFFLCKRCAVGKNTQKIALGAYIRKTGNDVCDCALFLFSCGFLGSSPDGIIYYEGIVGEKNKEVPEITYTCTHRGSKIKNAIENELGGKYKSRFNLTTTGA